MTDPKVGSEAMFRLISQAISFFPVEIQASSWRMVAGHLAEATKELMQIAEAGLAAQRNSRN